MQTAEGSVGFKLLNHEHFSVLLTCNMLYSCLVSTVYRVEGVEVKLENDVLESRILDTGQVRM